MALAILFESVGVGEWFVLLAVVLVVVGPKNLPSTARKLGGYYAKFRRAADSFKRQLMDMDSEFNRVVSEAEREVEAAAADPEEQSGEVPDPVEDPENEMYEARAEDVNQSPLEKDGNLPVAES